VSKRIVRVVFVVALLGLVSSVLAQGLPPVEQDRRVQNFIAQTNLRLQGVKDAILELQGLLQKIDVQANVDLKRLIAQIEQERARAAERAAAKAKAEADAKAKAEAVPSAGVGPRVLPVVEGPQPIPMEPK
jgi:ubiquinone biosynthesis protein UbiJ